jgi:rod shape-determining protein MreC
VNFYIKKQSFIIQNVLIGAGILIAVISISNIFQDQIKNAFYSVTAPISKSLVYAGNNSASLLGPFGNVPGLKQENDNLKSENQNLLLQIASLKDSLGQNQATNSIMQNTQDANFALVLAQPVGLDTKNSIITINKGSDYGIEENMPVISSQRAVYGRVIKVYKSFSKVLLISAKNSVVDVKISQPENMQNSTEDITNTPDKVITGAVKGNDNLSVYLDLVNSDANIHQNDILITSGLEGIFPRDLLVGKISSVHKNDLKAFQTADVSPFFTINSIDTLFVITNYLKK